MKLKNLHRRLLALGLLGLGACSVPHTSKPPKFTGECHIPPGAVSVLPDSYSSRITISSSSSDLSLNLYLEKDGQSILIVALNDFGNKLFTSRYEKGSFTVVETVYLKGATDPEGLSNLLLLGMLDKSSAQAYSSSCGLSINFIDQDHAFDILKGGTRLMRKEALSHDGKRNFSFYDFESSRVFRVKEIS